MNLKYGVFLQRKIDVDWDSWDSMPIGMHSATNRMLRENAETAHHEYYYNDDKGRTWIVKNPTTTEAIIARMTSFSGKKVVGYVDSSYKVDNTPQLLDRLTSEAQKNFQQENDGLEM